MKRQIPYGYQIQNGDCVIHEKEAQAVREIFDVYLIGWSYKRIAEKMNNSAYPLYKESGWNKNHVKRILENARYTGMPPYTAIVPETQFECVAEKRDGKRVWYKEQEEMVVEEKETIQWEYMPTAEVMRMENLLSRADAPPNERADLIMQGISMRYNSVSRSE